MSAYAKLFRHDSGTPLRDDESGSHKSGKAYTLCIVDDEDGVRNALKRVFAEESYRIITASGADEALLILERDQVNLVISDYMMPGMNGVDFLRAVKGRWPETIRIMLTGQADVQAVMGAVNDGAVYKFITKPWDDEDLRLTVSLALQQYELIQENKLLKDIARKQQAKIKNLSSMGDPERKSLANTLIRLKVLTPDDLKKIHMEKKEDEFLTETIVRLGIAPESKIIKALQAHLNIEFMDIKEAHMNSSVVKTLPKEFCKRNRLIPVRLEGNELLVAMADPCDIFLKDNVEFLTGLKAVSVISGSLDILDALKTVYGEKESVEFEDVDLIESLDPMDEIDIVIDEDDDAVDVQTLLSSSEVPPIIRVVNAIVSEAIRYRSSDIHIEPKTKFTLIRFRIDGILHNKIKIPIDFHSATISRIKILSKMDITERRRPQDGRFSVKSGARLVDIRVSTLPTINGEKVTLRIMDKTGSIRKIEELGVKGHDLKKIHALIRKPQGIIISTGPTGSGKTTMLYSLLNTMIQTTKNFETIEDPVEYFLEEANQVYIKDNIGLSFASVLRSTLRQDPDVILVGEIRDLETADVVFKAGLTGHMVLSTLHTNNSVASITRLIDIGVQPYLIASGIEGIIAQRLVRTTCAKCKKETQPEKQALDMLSIHSGVIGNTEWKGSGCSSCNNTGYFGRTGIYEVFVMSDEFRQTISSAYKESELYAAARTFGMKTLLEDAIGKVKSGETTLEEILRVLGPQNRVEYKCSSCNRMVEAKYSFCPFCGRFKQNLCPSCRMPLEDEWVMCPQCGSGRQLVGGKIGT